VGGVTRNPVQFALHPNWRTSNGDNVLDDVALIQLDQPVTTVAPVTLGAAVPSRGTILVGVRRRPPLPRLHHRSRPRVGAVTLSAATITGQAKVGATLTCGVSGYSSPPAKVAITWKVPRGGRQPVVGRSRTYTVRAADAGRRVLCELVASNDGGISSAPFDPRASSRKIPR
jgi:hypothetical protein